MTQLVVHGPSELMCLTLDIRMKVLDADLPDIVVSWQKNFALLVTALQFERAKFGGNYKRLKDVLSAMLQNKHRRIPMW